MRGLEYPRPLKLTGEKTKEELFVGTDSNSINDYGTSYGSVSNDEKKLAAVP